MRIALGIEYNGTNFHGWQKQPNLTTIQHSVESALSFVANHAIQIHCAGRTDVGVHALEQVIHFDTKSQRELKSWVLGGNSNTPSDINIRWAKQVDENFHARFSAKARRYRYIIYNNDIRSALFANHVAWHYKTLDAQLMHEAGQHLIGEHDFSAFRGSGCQSKTPMRNVQLLRVTRRNKLIIVDIKANAFLLHMVRNIAGVLIAIGEKKYPPIWAKQVLESCNRRSAEITASPYGLYLAKVYY